MWRAARDQAEVRGWGSLGSLEEEEEEEGACSLGASRKPCGLGPCGWMSGGCGRVSVEVLTRGWMRRGRPLAWGASGRCG